LDALESKEGDNVPKLFYTVIPFAEGACHLPVGIGKAALAGAGGLCGLDDADEKAPSHQKNQGQIQGADESDGSLSVEAEVAKQNNGAKVYSDLAGFAGWGQTPDTMPLRNPEHSMVLRLLLAQLALALRGIHRNGIAHLDFKPDNVLLDGVFQFRWDGVFYQVPRVRLADFGLAEKVGDQLYNHSGHKRNIFPKIAAPELWDSQVSTEADWWSFGSLAAQLVVPTRFNTDTQYPKGMKGQKLRYADMYENLKQDVSQPFGRPAQIFTDLADLINTYLLKPREERYSSFSPGSDTFDHPFWQHPFWRPLDGEGAYRGRHKHLKWKKLVKAAFA
jgi:hypothetical protein